MHKYEEAIEGDRTAYQAHYSDQDIGTINPKSIVEQLGYQPRILVIDSSLDSFHRINSMLQSFCKPIFVSAIDDAIHKALTGLPDIVIIGTSLPVSSIIALSQTLKSKVLTSHIPNMVISTKAPVSNKAQFLAAGVDALIEQPYTNHFVRLYVCNLLMNRLVLRRYYTNEWAFANSVSTYSSDSHFVERVKSVIEKNYTNTRYNVSDLVVDMGISRSNLYTRLKNLTGQSTSDFLRSIRLKKGAELLRQGHLNVSEIAYRVGLRDPKYFSKQFKKTFGITPSAFQKGDKTNAEIS